MVIMEKIIRNKIKFILIFGSVAMSQTLASGPSKALIGGLNWLPDLSGALMKIEKEIKISTFYSPNLKRPLRYRILMVLCRY